MTNQEMAACWQQFMALRQGISARKLQQKVGTVQTILIDTVADDYDLWVS